MVLLQTSHKLLFEGFGAEGCLAFEEGSEMGLILEAQAVGDLLDGKSKGTWHGVSRPRQYTCWAKNPRFA